MQISLLYGMKIEGNYYGRSACSFRNVVCGLTQGVYGGGLLPETILNDDI